MQTSGHDLSSSKSRRPEQGNIVLIAAMIVLALGLVGLSVSQLIQTRMNYSANLRLSNFAGTLARNVAESVVNNLIYNWNTGLTSPMSTSSLSSFPVVSTTYPNYTVNSSNAFSVFVKQTAVLPTPTFLVTVQTTVTSTTPSNFQSISRTVNATVASSSYGYCVEGYY